MQIEPITQEVLMEGVAVGATLIPAYAVSRRVLAGMKLKSERTKDFVAVALAGFLFHVVAESTGVNRWYVLEKGVRGSTNGSRNSSAGSSPDSRVCPLAVAYCSTSSR